MQPREGHRGVLLAPWGWAARLRPLLGLRLGVPSTSGAPCYRPSPPSLGRGVLLPARQLGFPGGGGWSGADRQPPGTEEQQVGLPAGPGHKVCTDSLGRGLGPNTPSELTFVKRSILCYLAIFSSSLLGFHSQQVLTSALAPLWKALYGSQALSRVFFAVTWLKFLLTPVECPYRFAFWGPACAAGPSNSGICSYECSVSAEGSARRGALKESPTLCTGRACSLTLLSPSLASWGASVFLSLS